MNSIVAVLLMALASQPKVSISLAAPVNQADLARKCDQLSANLTPSAKLKLQNAARSLATAPAITEAAARTAVLSAFPGTQFSESDVAGLAMLVLYEVSQSQADDLKNILAEQGKMKQQQQELRGRIATLGKNSTTTQRPANVHMAVPVDSFRTPESLPPNADANAIQSRLAELADLESGNRLKLQEIETQIEKTTRLASNIARNIHDMNSTVIRNLR